MRRFFLTCVLGLGFFLAPVGEFRAQAMQADCGCGGGVVCKTKWQLFVAVAASFGVLYHNTVLQPLAADKGPQGKKLVYGMGYGIPALAVAAGYQWWNSAPSKDAAKESHEEPVK